MPESLVGGPAQEEKCQQADRGELGVSGPNAYSGDDSQGGNAGQCESFAQPQSGGEEQCNLADRK